MTAEAIEAASKPKSGGVSWSYILKHWDWVMQDCQQVYNIDLDLDNELVWQNRTWAWVRRLIIGLFSTDSRILRNLPEGQT